MAGDKAPTEPDPDGDLIARGGHVDRQRLFELYQQQTGDDEQPISVRLRLRRDPFAPTTRITRACSCEPVDSPRGDVRLG